MADYSGYPMCVDGDVLIHLSPERPMKLHSEPLKRHCGSFAKFLRDNPGAELTPSAKRAGAAKWRFDLLIKDHGYGGGILIPVALGPSGEPIGHTIHLTSDAGLAQGPDVIAHFEMVLGAVYSRPLEFHQESLKDIVDTAYGVLDAADYLDCVHLITRPIDSVLLEGGQKLWGSIARDPIQWGALGIRLRSFNITRESIIHLVGQWALLSAAHRDALPVPLKDFCSQKNKELHDSLQVTIQKLFAYYHPKMKRTEKICVRSEFCNDIMEWIAMSAVKTFFCKELYERKEIINSGNGWGFFKALAEGEEKYLTKEDLRPFFANFQMTTRGSHSIENAIKNMKQDISGIVAPLMVNNTNLQGTDPTEYFVCTEVKKEDMAGMWVEHTRLDWTAPPRSTARGHPTSEQSAPKRQRATPSSRDPVFNALINDARESQQQEQANGSRHE